MIKPLAGIPATSASLDDPFGIVTASDGSYYIADWGSGKVRRVRRDGIIETVAGGGGSVPSTAGIPARSAYIGRPRDVTVSSNGEIFVASQFTDCVYRVDLEGLIYRHVCGLGVEGLDVDREGNLIVAAWETVEMIDRAGQVTRLAGTGQTGYSGDGGPALLAELHGAVYVSVGPAGQIYVSDLVNRRVRKISPDGRIVTVAGDGRSRSGPDGIPGPMSSLRAPIGLQAAPDGSLYLVDTSGRRVRWLRSNGIITTIAGDGSGGHEGDGGPAEAANTRQPVDVAILPSGDLLVSDFQNQTVRKIANSSLPGFDAANLTVPSPDGAVLYVFDLFGRHLETRHALTGGLLLKPRYDVLGRLESIQDGEGNTTRILRGGNGEPESIVGPFGTRIGLETDSNGYLSSIVLPDDTRYRFEYGNGGLLTAVVDPDEHRTEYLYSSGGRLIETTGAADATRIFRRWVDGNGFTGEITKSSGASTRHRVTKLAVGGELRQMTRADGTVVTMVRGLDGTQTTTRPDGTVISTKTTGDPRFGLVVPRVAEATVQTPSGLRFTVRQSREVTTAATALDLESQIDHLEVNGRTFTTRFDASTKAFVSMSAEGRQTSVEIDDLGRTTRVEAPQVEPLRLSYRTSGAIESITVGKGAETRTTSLAYDSEERLDTVTDPLSRTVLVLYDQSDRITQITLPDAVAVGFSYDASDNVTSITPPGRPAYAFTYTPTNLLETYVLPDVGAGPSVESRTYDLDQRLIGIKHADGRTLALDYDSETGQLNTITSPRGFTLLDYQEATGQLTSIVEPGGEQLSFAWDGPLLTTAIWSGSVAGSVAWTYDTSFRPQTVSVNGVGAIAYSYDQDSLVTSAGALTIAREADTGRESTTTLSGVTSVRTYTPFGEPDTFTVEFGGNVIYAEDLDYDARGWITNLRRTQNGGTFDWSFGYDLRGRLETVEIDGAPKSTYGYDANSNRISYDGQFGTVLSADVTVDDRDRLLDYDDLTYSYTDAGELLASSQNGQTVHYDYDVFGNLRKVELPSGTIVEYVTDSANRRVGRKVNGSLVQGFLYQDSLNPIAELDGAGKVVSLFVYASRSNIPDYMIREGVTYRIVADHLGSPRLVVDVDSGIVAQELRYDEFGRVTLDTNRGFQPFGFAGGLTDIQTELVRFGARDYDPRVGRWTARDPLGFSGGSFNLYSYASLRPTTIIDPSGLTITCDSVNPEWIAERNKKARELLNFLPEAVLDFFFPITPEGIHAELASAAASVPIMPATLAIGPGTGLGRYLGRANPLKPNRGGILQPFDAATGRFLPYAANPGLRSSPAAEFAAGFFEGVGTSMAGINEGSARGLANRPYGWGQTIGRVVGTVGSLLH